MYACSLGRVEVARMLMLEFNANVDIQNAVIKNFK